MTHTQAWEALGVYHVMLILMRSANIPLEQATTILAAYSTIGPTGCTHPLEALATRAGVDLSPLLPKK